MEIFIQHRAEYEWCKKSWIFCFFDNSPYLNISRKYKEIFFGTNEKEKCSQNNTKRMIFLDNSVQDKLHFVTSRKKKKFAKYFLDLDRGIGNFPMQRMHRIDTSRGEKEKYCYWRRKGEENFRREIRVIIERRRRIGSDAILDVEPEADPVSRHARARRGCARPQRIACFLLRRSSLMDLEKNLLASPPPLSFPPILRRFFSIVSLFTNSPIQAFRFFNPRIVEF